MTDEAACNIFFVNEAIRAVTYDVCSSRTVVPLVDIFSMFTRNKRRLRDDRMQVQETTFDTLK